MQAGITAWLDRPPQKSGLDNIGTQQPCVLVYSSLLPGITNVTDRAYHLGFYPWFIREFGQRFPDAPEATFREWFRRADCLLTLIAERHGSLCPGPDRERHAGACPGRLKLGPAVQRLAQEGGSLALSAYTDRAETNTLRYFKNPLGGLGQYYLGQLRDEYGALRGDAGTGVQYTEGVGEALALAAAEGIPGDAFFDVLKNDTVTCATLDSLSAFCPCTLATAARAPARSALAALLLESATPNGLARRDTLRLLARYFKAAASDPAAARRSDPVRAFLEACYCRALPSGPWEVPGGLEAARAGWALYARNEMMSLAWITVFKLALDALQAGPPVPGGVAAVCQELLRRPQLAWRPIAGFDALVLADLQDAPAVTECASPAHEFALWEALSGSRAPSLQAAAALLVRLVARTPGKQGAYAAAGIPPQALAAYPLTLDTLPALAGDRWTGLDGAAWLESLLVEVMATHQRIAIRKMGQSGEDTLMVRANDLGYFVHRPQEAVVATQPRLKQAIQVLRDLGYVVFPEAGLPQLTSLGETLAGEAA